MSEDEEPNDGQKKALLTLAIELGDKKKQLLNIYLDSKPEQLAYDFCLQNNLDFDSMENLKEEIKNALANYNADNTNKNDKKENQEEGELKNEENEENEIEENKPEEISKEHEQEEQDEKEIQEEQNININENDVKKEKIEENEINIAKKEGGANIAQEQQKEDKEIQQEKKEDVEKEQNQEKEINKELSNEKDNKTDEVHLEKEKNEEKEPEQIKQELDDNNNKEEATEEALLKEEERDKVLEQNNEEEKPEAKENAENGEENENESEEEDIQSYLSPTICFQNKQREKFKEKPKQEFPEFDTTYQKYDKISEFRKEFNEKPVNYLTINASNQKYLPKDYYDNPENKNFGERLYVREKVMKETAMEKAKAKAKKENKKIEENMTFSPKINDYNLIALQNRKINKMKYNEEKRILNYKDYLKERDENTKNKHYTDIEKENTFAPKIDKNSEKLAGNRSLQVPRYEQLYKKKFDIKKLEDKIYDNKYMFKPKINKNYKGIKTDNNKMSEYAKLTFEERQKRFKERLIENKEKLIEINKSNVEKKYFKPTINKNKKLDIERKNKKIFNELYRDSTKYQVKREELIKKINELERGLY